MLDEGRIPPHDLIVHAVFACNIVKDECIRDLVFLQIIKERLLERAGIGTLRQRDIDFNFIVLNIIGFVGAQVHARKPELRIDAAEILEKL